MLGKKGIFAAALKTVSYAQPVAFLRAVWVKKPLLVFGAARAIAAQRNP